MDSGVADYLVWLEASRNLGHASIEAYRKDLEGFSAFLESEGVGHPVAIDVRFVRAWLHNLHGHGFSRTSVARKLSSLRGYLDWLCRRGVLPSNPAALVSTPKRGTRLPRHLHENEILPLVDELSALEDRPDDRMQPSASFSIRQECVFRNSAALRRGHPAL